MEKIFEMSELSDCEKMIMGCIYTYAQRTGYRPDLKVIMKWTSEVYGKEWKPQTVCTFISRMVKKGVLKSEKVGRVSYYEPSVSFDAYVKKEMKELCNIFFDGNCEKMKNFVLRNL